MTKLGKTGTYPLGKLGKDDEGDITMGVAAHEGNVIINFGTPVSWFALPPKAARALAALLVTNAAKAEKAHH